MIVVDEAEEKKHIRARYRSLLRKARPYLKEGDAKLIKKAFYTSFEAHKNMRRRSGEPYIFHPLAVAQICVEEIGLGTTSIVAALLHDVVEDTDKTIEDIEADFGPKIAEIIDGLTKISGVFEYGTSQQAENFRKMLLTMSQDVRVILIKLADRLHNMRTLDSMPRNKQLKIASETSYLYAPLAHRLGLYAMKSEMEDLWLKYTEPDVYRSIANKISAAKESRARFIKTFSRPITEKLKELGMEFKIKGRPKSIFSIWNKMKKQKVPFEQVFDLFAIRIILDAPYEKEKAACWQAYSVVTDFYKPNPDRLRDWISTPKSNGYESLHTTVMSRMGTWVEVQIRTQRMDEIAEKGYAAHWKYKHQSAAKAKGPKDKGPKDKESGLEEWITSVRTMLEDSQGNAIEFVDDFRSNFFQEEVFVFTPRGDLRTLPFGSTALDFAFDIHTEVGARCLGAKVNNKLVPLKHELKNGDQVEILTSQKQKPNESWLEYVKSSKARAKIKDLLKEEKKAAATDGREIINRKLKQMRLEPTQEVVEQIRAYFDAQTPLDLYYKVGKGIINAKDIKQFKEVREKHHNGRRSVISDAKSFARELTKTKGKETDTLLIGDDMSEVDYTLAKCCHPIAGDNVFGFVTINEGIKVHRTTCPNATELLSKHGNRVVKATWASQQAKPFLAGLTITGSDRLGLMNDVTRIISSELSVNMQSVAMNSKEGIFEGLITLFVHDRHHLDMLIQKLKKVNGVDRVTRNEDISKPKQEHLI